MKTKFYDRKLGFKLMAILFAFLFAPSFISAQTTVTIGDTTSTGYSYYIPVNAYYDYSWSAQIVKQSEMGTVGKITSISFLIQSTPSNYTMPDQKIYMGLVPDSAFSSTSYITPSSIGASLVYSGSITYGAAGWVTITFPSSYAYSGGNLVILYENRDGDYDYPYPKFIKSSSPESNMVKYKFQDSSFPAVNGSYYSTRSVMRFTLTPLDANDLAMMSILTPVDGTSPDTAMTISVAVKNAGTVAQDSFYLAYSLDSGATYISELFLDTIQALATDTFTFATTADMSVTGQYLIAAKVTNTGDVEPNNDSIASAPWIGDPLNGTYTIGNKVTDDFSSISDATNSLKYYGMSGSVTFMLDSITFNEQIFLEGPINGSSVNNGITFKGYGAGTVIEGATTSSARDVMLINTINNVTVDSITFTATGTTYGTGIRVIESDSVTIMNCTISTSLTSTSSYFNGVLVVGSTSSSYSSTEANYFTFNNNTINGGYYSLGLKGNSSNHSSNVLVSNNTFADFTYYGLYSYYQDSIDFHHNTIYDRGVNSYVYGLYAYKNYLGSRVAYNNIVNNSSSGGYGLYLAYCEGDSIHPWKVYNNMVAVPNATGSFRALYLSSCNSINLFYNTASVTKGGSSSAAAYISGSTSSYYNFGNIKMKNNNFANMGSGFGLNIYGGYFYPSHIVECDYNNIYSIGTFGHYGSYGSSNDVADLATWKALAYGLDSNSVSTNPIFVSDADAHANSLVMNGAAIPVAGIDDDIDGDIRNTSTPDIGADEYTPPADEVSVDAYIGLDGASCAFSSSENITIVVVNNGTNNQTNVPVKYIVDGGAIISETIATLNSMAIDTFTFATQADLSTPGAHTIVAYCALPIDTKRDNDTVYVDLFKVGGISSFPYFQGFETTPLEFGLESGNNAKIYLSARASNGQDSLGLLMTGNVYDGWNSPYSTVEDAFNSSPTHISSATACNVNASSLSGLYMRFDLKMNHTYNSNYSWFRVMLNDTVYAKDVSGDSTWKSTTANDDVFKMLLFDLSAYNSSILSISLQTVAKYDIAAYSGNYGDEAFIDNFELWEPTLGDAGIISVMNPHSANCGTSGDSVMVKIMNFGSDSLYSTPVKVEITTPNGTTSSITATCTDTIAPGETLDFEIGNMNTNTEDGTYSLKAYTQNTGDTHNTNDTLNYDFMIDYPVAIPYLQDFQDSYNVDYDGNGYRTSVYPNYFYQIYMSAYSGNNKELAFNKKIGAVTSDSYLTFDFWDFYYGVDTSMMVNDSVLVLIASDCSDVYDTLAVIDTFTYVPSSTFEKYTYSLAAYTGSNVHIKFISSRNDNASGSKYFRFDNVSISTPPMADLGADTTVCDGMEVELTTMFDANYSYIWTNAITGDTLLESDTLNMFTVDTAGTYAVGALTIQGLNTYDTIVVAYYPLTPVTISGLAASYCANEMSTTLSGTPANGFFYGNGVDSAGIFDPSMSGVGTQVITYSYTDANTCTNTANDTTMVYDAPMAMMTPDTTICDGSTIDIAAGSTMANPSLLFSSYIEGSSNNKALEIYNASTDTINLDDYSIMTNYNGNAWSGQYHFPMGSTLAPGDVFVVANEQADAMILAVADDSLAYNEGGYVVGFNGDDVRAIFHKTSATDSMMIDIIGRYDMFDPGSGWDVAGVSAATKDHTLKRKSYVGVGNTDWDAIAGTDSLDAEYLVYDQNDFSMIGSHTAMPYVASTYLWSTGATTATITVNPSTTTTYSCTVSNTNCSDIGSVTVTVNPMPVVNLGADTTIKWSWALTLDAANPNASFLWSTGATTQTETFDSLNLTNGVANTVYVEVDANGCMTTDTIVITVMDDNSINNTLNNVSVNVYPNPSNGQFTLAIEGLNGDFDMTIIDLAGQVVYSNSLTATMNFNTKVDVRTLATGVYYIKLSNNDGVKTSKLIIK